MAKGIKGFTKGNKLGGNKPKIPPAVKADVKAIFLRETPGAIQRLVELSKCQNKPVALKANELIIAYGIGKPVQPIGNDPESKEGFKIKVETVAQSIEQLPDK